jgi:predicted nuclease of predicted toxin-antitoxin system
LDILDSFGHECFHARKIGLSDAEDSKLFDYAVSNNLMLVTKDLDFGNQNNFDVKKSAGVVIIRLPFYFTADQINNNLTKFLNQIEIQDIEGKITILQLGRFKIRDV